MSRVDSTIARIPTMTAKSRAALRNNAEDKIAREPGNEDARRIIEALDAFEGDRAKTADLEVTGLLAWEKRCPGQTTFLAFYGDKAVGKIFKRANHSMTEKDVYSLEILGETIPGDFHHIRDAREAGERAFAARQDGSSCWHSRAELVPRRGPRKSPTRMPRCEVRSQGSSLRRISLQR